MFRKCLALLLTVSFIISVSIQSGALDTELNTVDVEIVEQEIETVPDEEEGGEFESESERELKIICTATIDDDFADNALMVAIYEDIGSGTEEEYKEYFGNDSRIATIENLTDYSNGSESLRLSRKHEKQVLLLTLTTHDKQVVLDVIKDIEQFDEVMAAEPDYVLEIAEDPSSILGYAEEQEQIPLYPENNWYQNPCSIDTLAAATNVGNDKQWGLDAINVADAWQITTGKKDVKVGVMEFVGVMPHPGLAGRLEYVYDAVKDEVCTPEEAYSDLLTNNDKEYSDHATAVAGVIGSNGDAIGVCQNVTLVSFIIDGNMSNIDRALKHAGENGIMIMNGSFEFTWLSTPDADPAYTTLKTAVKQYPGLYVCSAGNDNKDVSQSLDYPRKFLFDNIINVAAVERDENNNLVKWSDSDFSISHVEISAPGDRIYTTVAPVAGDYKYNFKYATSFAAPFVAGVAGLILSKYPGLQGTHLKRLLIEGAQEVDALKPYVKGGAFLDAEGALLAAADQTVKLSFEYNGSNVQGNDEAFRYCVRGMTIDNLPVPTRDGWVFKGWRDANNFYPVGTSITGGISSATTLTAEWWQPTYTYIIYNGNGGCERITETVPYGKSFTITRSAQRTGCTFKGWNAYTKESDIPNAGNVTGPHYGTGGKITPTEDLFFCAVWEATISFVNPKGNDQTATVMFVQSATLDIDQVAVADGYKFLGWKYNDSNYYPGDTLTGIQGHTTLNAEWEELSIYLHFDGPEYGVNEAQTVTYGQYLAEEELVLYTPPSFELSGPYAYYKGWRVKNGDGTIYPADDGYSYFYKFKNYAFEPLVLTPPNPSQITVVYNANGGVNAPMPQSDPNGDYITITKQEPTLAGQTFVGWATSEDGAVEYAPGSRFTTHSTYFTYPHLYAQWAENRIVVRFDTGTEDDDAVPAYDPPLSIVCDRNVPMVTIPQQTPIRDGYRFLRWVDKSNNDKEYKRGVTYNLSDYGKDLLRLTAVWEPLPGTVATEPVLVMFYNSDEYGWLDAEFHGRLVTPGSTYGEAMDTDRQTMLGMPTVADITYKDGAGNTVTRAYFDGWADADGNRITADTKVTRTDFHMLYARMIPYANYNDMPTYPGAGEAVSLCKKYGYMTGTAPNTFSPDLSVSRGTAAIVLYRLAGASPYYGSNRYYDVKTDSGELSRAVTWISENGIATGRNSDNAYFGQQETITREELAVMLYRYAELYHLDKYSGNSLGSFSDYDQCTPAFRPALQWAISHGIITGVTDTLLSPKGIVNRHQLAVFIARMHKFLAENGVIDTIEVDGVDQAAEQLGHVSPILSENSWETISAVSRAGLAPYIWNVGDETSLTLSTGEVIEVQIYGFYHDKLTGSNRTAGITFGMKSVMKTPRFMHDVATNECIFTGTRLYLWMDSTLFDYLPSDVSAAIRPVDKDVVEFNSDGTQHIIKESMRLFLFSEEECFGQKYHSFGGEGTQYPIFQNGANRIKIREPQHIIEWWLRSPSMSNSHSYGIVHATGHAGYTSATTNYIGVSFGFCV